MSKYCHCTHWQFRNNSANVAAILHPETNLKSSDHSQCDNTCYCRKKKIPPQLFSRPKKSQLFETEKWVPSFKILEDSGVIKKLKEHTSCTCNCSSSYQTDSTGKSLEENHRKSQNFSKRGEDFDSYLYNDKDYHKTTTTSLKESLPTSSNEGQIFEKSSKNTGYEKFTSIELTPESSHTDLNNTKNSKTDEYNERKETSQTNLSDVEDKNKPSAMIPNQNFEASDKSNLKQLIDFRTDHYFETHSTEDLTKSVPEHICVHSFSLDNRLLPQPLHQDVYGTSRCIICGKPMENPPINRIDERSEKKKNIFPKFYKYGLAPKKIYMANDESVKVEMKLNCRDENYKIRELKRPNYFNTFALRYQKGVV